MVLPSLQLSSTPLICSRNDILRKHKIIPEKPPSPTKQLEEALIEARKLAHENRLESKDLDELSDLEDLEDEDFLESYRQRRMAEMREVQQKSRFGHVVLISRDEWSKEVTEASQAELGPRPEGSERKNEDGKDCEREKQTVLVHMAHEAVPDSVWLSRVFRDAAPKFPEIKFCEILGRRAVEGYPKERCPTIIVYRGGDVVDTILGWRSDKKWGVCEIGDLLVRVKAVSEKDMRVVRLRREREEEAIEGAAKGKEEEDYDSDF